MQESFRVKLKNPEQYQGVVSSVVGLKGVQKVQDLHQLLDPFFRALNVLQWSTGRRLGPAAARLGAADRQHDPAGHVRPTTRDRHHAAGRREQLLHHSAVPARGGDLGPDRRRCWPARRWPPGCTSGSSAGSPESVRFVAWIGWRQTGLAMLGHRRGGRGPRGHPDPGDYSALPQGLTSQPDHISHMLNHQLTADNPNLLNPQLRLHHEIGGYLAPRPALPLHRGSSVCLSCPR